MKVKKILKDLEMSKKQFAHEVGVNPVTVSRWVKLNKDLPERYEDKFKNLIGANLADNELKEFQQEEIREKAVQDAIEEKAQDAIEDTIEQVCDNHINGIAHHLFQAYNFAVQLNFDAPITQDIRKILERMLEKDD